MSAKRRPLKVSVDWTPAIAELFQIVPGDWTAPAKAHLVQTAQGNITVSARYVMPNGAPTMARVRLRRDRDGDWFSTEQSLAVRL
jgi:hypothetical protein